MKLHELAIRFAFGAAISVIAALISEAFGAHAGGMFLAFPAILPATLTLIQSKQSTRKAGRDAFGAILGAVGLVAFAAVGALGFDRFAAPAVLSVACGAWLLVAVGAYSLLCIVRPDVCADEPDSEAGGGPERLGLFPR